MDDEPFKTPKKKDIIEEAEEAFKDVAESTKKPDKIEPEMMLQRKPTIIYPRYELVDINKLENPKEEVT